MPVLEAVERGSIVAYCRKLVKGLCGGPGGAGQAMMLDMGQRSDPGEPGSTRVRGLGFRVREPLTAWPVTGAFGLDRLLGRRLNPSEEEP